MSEQIEFNMDAEYSLRVAEHPELVEIDLGTYEEFEIESSEETDAWAAEQRQRNERDIWE